MTRILLDYIQRHWWIWLLACIGYGVILAAPAEVSGVVIVCAIWMGPLSLQFDMRYRGTIRAQLAMPVTARQLGRTLWWEAVGLPSIVLAAITVLVHTLRSIFSAHAEPFSVDFGYWLTAAIFNGITYFLLLGGPSPGRSQGWAASVLGYTLAIMFSLLMTFGWLILPRLIPMHSKAWEAFTLVGMLVGAAGWLRSEEIIGDRIGVNKEARVSRGAVPENAQWMRGCGGAPYLMQYALPRLVLFGLAMLPAGVLYGEMLSTLRHGTFDLLTSLVKRNNIMFVYQWGIVFTLVQGATYLRHLRTLPLSTSKLAALLVLLPMAALIVTIEVSGLALLALLHHPLSMLAAFSLLGGVLQVAIAALVVPVIVWRSQGGGTMGVIAALFIACFQSWRSVEPNLSLVATILASAFLIALSLTLTWLLLKYESEVYRPRQINSSDAFAQV
ncbi:MAG: hypothetical protein P4L33_21820 [Capsulimonadaceae bacterium]|nr:hypothetical protein [Capsulimonadaceae bacterium]